MSRAERFRRWADESAVSDILIAGALAASSLHVYSVCRVNGSTRPVAVLTVVAVELLAFAALRDLRRFGARRAPIGLAGVVVGFGLTIAANLAAAADNGPGWGWPETVAVAPAGLAALALLMRETRPTVRRPVVVARKGRTETPRTTPPTERREQVAPPPPSPPATVPAGQSRPASSREIVAAACDQGVEPAWDPDNGSHRRSVQRRIVAAKGGSEPDRLWLARLGYRPDGTPLPEEDRDAVRG